MDDNGAMEAARRIVAEYSPITNPCPWANNMEVIDIANALLSREPPAELCPSDAMITAGLRALARAPTDTNYGAATIIRIWQEMVRAAARESPTERETLDDMQKRIDGLEALLCDAQREASAHATDSNREAAFVALDEAIKRPHLPIAWHSLQNIRSVLRASEPDPRVAALQPVEAIVLRLVTPKLKAAMEECEASKLSFKEAWAKLIEASEVRPLSLPPEPTGDARELRSLIYELSDMLTDEGPSWSNIGIDRLRCRVAKALPDEECPDWLRPYKSFKPEPTGEQG